MGHEPARRRDEAEHGPVQTAPLPPTPSRPASQPMVPDRAEGSLDLDAAARSVISALGATEGPVSEAGVGSWARAMGNDELREHIISLRAQQSRTPMVLLAHGRMVEALAALEDEAAERGLGVDAEAAPPQPVSLHLDPKRPWIVQVDTEGATPRDIAFELYGVDISPIMPREELLFSGALNAAASALGVDLGLPTKGSLTILQPMLVPAYAEEFHTKMDILLNRDLARTRQILLYETHDRGDLNALDDLSAYWSRRGDLQARDGGSYFDAYLGALDSSYLHTDWLLFESNRRSFLDELFNVVSNPVFDGGGALTERIARRSAAFGANTPAWALEDSDGGTGGDAPNPRLVERAADVILERMEGMGLPAQSAAIVDTMKGLPAGVQQAVLKKIMDAHEDTIAWGAVGRFGEPTGEHMIYHLFETLQEDDREELAKVLSDSGLLTEEGARVFVEGRSWAGRNLPWSTYHGSEAAKYWQAEYDQGGSSLNLIGAGFAGLWTPDTAGNTILALATARIGLPFLSRAPAALQKTLLAFGTFSSTYAATTALVEAAHGETADGRALNEGQRVTRMLQGVMELAFLAEAANAARQADKAMALVRGPQAPTLGTAHLPGSAPSGSATSHVISPGIAGGEGGGIRILKIGDDGTVTAVARSAQGEFAYLRMDVNTGNGTIVFPDRGVYPIEAGQLVAPRPALGPGQGPVAPPPGTAGMPGHVQGPAQLGATGSPTHARSGAAVPAFIESRAAGAVNGRSMPGRQQYEIAPGSGVRLPASARAETPRSQRTAVDADLLEVNDYKALLNAGEVGLARPNGANRRGPDSITYDPVTQTIYVNDSQLYWSDVPRVNKATGVPPRWRREARAAAAQVDVDDPALADAIRAAARRPGGIQRRNHTPRRVPPPDPGTGPFIDIGPDIDIP